MFRFIVLLVAAVACLALITGCGSSSTSTGPAPVRSAKTIYVDQSNTGSADGTLAHPYKTITAALGAGVADDTIQIAAGTYNTGESFPLQLKPGNVLLGANRSTTIIQGALLDNNTGTSDPVIVRDLRFTGFSFSRNASTGTVTGTNLIHNCLVDSNVAISHGGGHNFQIENCQIHGKLTFNHGAGNSINRVIANQVDGGLRFATGNGATDSVIDNDIMGDGFAYFSGSTDAYIGGNRVNNAQFVDASGPGAQIIEYNSLTYQLGAEVEDTVAVALKGSSAIFRHNFVDGNYASGIRATSGTPTTIDYNQVSVTNARYAILTKAGSGEIVGNLILGGWCGLHDESAATLISMDTIYYADTGLYSSSAAVIRGNSIANCSGAGMFLHGASGPVDSNHVYANLIGVMIDLETPDLGGGNAVGFGHNWLTENYQYDLKNGTSNPIKAENNLWDHNNATDISDYDIYDHTDNTSVGPVDFEPFL